jgi:hypothetical protein
MKFWYNMDNTKKHNPKGAVSTNAFTCSRPSGSIDTQKATGAAITHIIGRIDSKYVGILSLKKTSTRYTTSSGRSDKTTRLAAISTSG